MGFPGRPVPLFIYPQRALLPFWVPLASPSWGTGVVKDRPPAFLCFGEPRAPTCVYPHGSAWAWGPRPGDGSLAHVGLPPRLPPPSPPFPQPRGPLPSLIGHRGAECSGSAQPCGAVCTPAAPPGQPGGLRLTGPPVPRQPGPARVLGAAAVIRSHSP